MHTSGQHTDPIQAEQATPNNMLYDLLLESINDYAIYALDADGNILTWNAGAKNLKGYSAEEIIGRHFLCFIPTRM